MRKEQMLLEHGVIDNRGESVFGELYLRVFAEEVLGFIFEDVRDKKRFLDFLRGDGQLIEGRFYWQEEALYGNDITGVLKNNVSVIEKKSKLIRSISTEENIYLFREKSWFLRKKQFTARFEDLKRELGVSLPHAKNCMKLSAKERVIVELMKAYAEEKKIVILEGLVSFLQEDEIDEVYALIQRLKSKGMTFLITIEFEEMGVNIMNRIAVVQYGNIVAIIEAEATGVREVFAQFRRHQYSLNKYKRKTTDEQEFSEDEMVLKFKQVSTNYLKDIDFEIEKGDILKIFYMDDYSCEEILDVLKGRKTLTSGEILLNDKKYSVRHTHQAVRKGIGFMEEVSYRTMLFENRNVLENVSIPLDNKTKFFWTYKKYVHSVALVLEQLFEEPMAKKKLWGMSPRKLQQIILTKWLLYSPEVLVCVNPLADSDIHLRQIVIEMLQMLREQGIAILLLTSNIYTDRRIEGETIYIKEGNIIDENEMYQVIYNASPQR